MFGLFEPGHIIVLVVLVLVLFGPDRLPEIMRGAGKAVREMRKLAAEFQLQFEDYVNDDKKPPARRPTQPTGPRPAPQKTEAAAPETEPTVYAALHPPVPEYGAETPESAAPIETPVGGDTDRVPAPPQIIDNGQTIPRQKPAPQPEV